MSKHTHKTGTVLMVAGAALMMVGSQGQLNASITNQGSYVGTIEPTGLELVQPNALLAAAPESPISFGVLAFGMLLMLVGFGFHAWVVLREREEKERTVPVRAATKKKTARKSRRQAEVIWIERTIRF